MPIDCTSANLSQQEKTLCTCKLATDAMVKTLKVYETLSTNYTSDKTAYDREKKDTINGEICLVNSPIGLQEKSN